MIVNFPSPSPGNITGLFLVQVLETIKRAFSPVLTKDEAAPRVLLQQTDGAVYSVTVSDVLPKLLLKSPNGTKYEIKVDNTGALSTSTYTGSTNGTLTTTLVDGKTREI